MNDDLVKRLASLPQLGKIPREELEWLVDNGQFETYEVGTIVGPKGKPVKKMWIVLSGKVAIHVDRGVGPKLVTEWQMGDVTGMLPYSRMSGPPGDNYIGETAELLAIEVKLFPEMIPKCPHFTALTVHSMLDRVRNFNTSDLQDEKMISLGKLAAGLSHELNNPASATVRDANLMLDSLARMDDSSRLLGASGLNVKEFEEIERMRSSCLVKSDSVSLSPIEKADHQDKICKWLEQHHLDPAYAVILSDTAITLSMLEEMKRIVSKDRLEIVLKWFVSRCNTHVIATDMKKSANQIYKLVNAVKQFTFMDQLAEKTMVEVMPGIIDTLRILNSKIESKNAVVNIDINEDLPLVNANGSELNQVLFNLLDNALDAIPDSGQIDILGFCESSRVIICIIDNGHGIPQKTISRIFDPFFTTKPPGHGTGLGLNLAQRFLRRYHGDITVQSKPGKTEFRIHLMIKIPE